MKINSNCNLGILNDAFPIIKYGTKKFEKELKKGNKNVSWYFVNIDLRELDFSQYEINGVCYVSNCALKNDLSNFPKCYYLSLGNCVGLKTVKGIPTDRLKIFNDSRVRTLTLDNIDGLPKVMHSLYLTNVLLLDAKGLWDCKYIIEEDYDYLRICDAFTVWALKGLDFSKNLEITDHVTDCTKSYWSNHVYLAQWITGNKLILPRYYFSQQMEEIHHTHPSFFLKEL